ncbi:uncharacterized protein CLUP02_16315 [Colletotrichum lupini]|uniref:Uncharacterized protein n=1 Tax=Colletotrichum lupini TaxID=145971 RepID=A0A9Q8WQ15_9PEZI|nr:uncharacterized protein CLUP02_16315 [Colletotrichum lupini]UQC90785.1 hypothetical protein CLUP02_16315 [Colletotrichum lupini]
MAKTFLSCRSPFSPSLVDGWRHHPWTMHGPGARTGGPGFEMIKPVPERPRTGPQDLDSFHSEMISRLKAWGTTVLRRILVQLVFWRSNRDGLASTTGVHLRLELVETVSAAYELSQSITAKGSVRASILTRERLCSASFSSPSYFRSPEGPKVISTRNARVRQWYRLRPLKTGLQGSSRVGPLWVTQSIEPQDRRSPLGRMTIADHSVAQSESFKTWSSTEFCLCSDGQPRRGIENRGSALVADTPVVEHLDPTPGTAISRTNWLQVDEPLVDKPELGASPAQPKLQGTHPAI